MSMTPLRIGILIFDDVEELDFVGPWEVLTMANEVAKHMN
jgi:putative intracellular protease/amidase